MDLEVVGRHALLFDDDATAAFTNSSDALVEWNGLSIDRYDVRHLLPSPPPPRKPRRQYTEDASLGSEIDHERYLDLPPPGDDEQELDLQEGPKPVDAGGYRAVAFSYGKSNESIEENNNDADSGFRPPFQVPESLLQNLPPTEKLHQIIARTAVFVSKHGGQSEIVLRVKQGDNPTFGFLMPDHHLHAYFRFLVDHQELFEPDSGSKSLEEKNIADAGPDHSGGALSILGSVYGSGEDEDGTTEDVPESEEAVRVGTANVCNGSEQAEPHVNAAGKDEVVAKSSFSIMKEKAPIIKRNRFISAVGNTSGNKNEGDALNALSIAGDKSQTSLPRTSKVEAPIVEPPSDLKRVVDKIVEFILRNGKEFEAVLVEQDKKHGRFPFLLPSNQYHAYYLEVLKKAKESKLPGKASVSEKHDSVGHGVDKKTASSKEGDTLSGGSASLDIPYNYDKKEKFKMVIGKSKKDGQDPPSKATEPQIDAAATAAILQAATRGIKNAGLEFFPRTSLNGSGRGPSIEGGLTSSFGSLQSSQHQNSISKPGQMGDPNVSAPVAKAIAETAAIAAASEADSSEACLTKEQKLKAERLKRAKMFAAMIKTGAAPMKTEALRGFSAEPPASGISGSGTDFENLLGKEREGSSVPMDVDTSDKTEKSDKKSSVDEYNERRLKRSYRSRSKRHEQEEEEEKEEREEEYKRAHKHSRKKHRSQRSSHHNRDRHKHRKRHSSSEDTDSRHVHNYDDSLDDKHWRSNYQHKHDAPSEDELRPSKHHRKHASSSDNERRHSRHRRKHHSSSSDDEHEHRSRAVRYRKSQPEEVDLEEGEILTKSDQSQASQGKGASREASVEASKSYQDERAPSGPSETTEVPDELRAKIRAMLMATL
ncbi:hypothetical protein I3842_12G130700 [Carya illinoinensis]|uniref:SURP motif domain-containing protein n=2 Tax=Carya illinoinensis TaxID=32201 RepID=A0A922IWP8_CARIL|nr:hypothetical protein I3842_12G130700 [Carya illinoinensis]